MEKKDESENWSAKFENDLRMILSITQTAVFT